MSGATSITTIARASEGLYKEKGSKFFAYAFPVNSDEGIKERLSEIKEEHPKARHHCLAYRLGSPEIVEYTNDAGEPSGSAGLPILNALRSSGLNNVLVIVVRYFGGTKLGIPGLIHAYKEATIDALGQNTIIEQELMSSFRIKLRYEEIDLLYKVLGRTNGKIVNQQIDTLSEFEVTVPLKDEKTFLELFSDGKEVERI